MHTDNFFGSCAVVLRGTMASSLRAEGVGKENMQSIKMGDTQVQVYLKRMSPSRNGGTRE